MVPAPVFVRKLACGVGQEADGPSMRVPLTRRSMSAEPSATLKVAPETVVAPRPIPWALMVAVFDPPLTVTPPRSA